MFIEKDDVSLYYEVRGNGDPLILIHGVIVDAGLYEEAARLLAGRFRVVTYDRRGYSRSVFRKPAYGFRSRLEGESGHMGRSSAMV